MEFVIVTNNNKVFNFYKETNEVFYFQKMDFIDLLNVVREKIYAGHRLLSDPIMYNLENADNPYKSIALSIKYEEDKEQKKLIDNVINIAKKIPARKHFSDFDEVTLEEFRFVDLNLLTDGIKEFSF